MKKNLAASIVALSLMFVPGYAQSGQGDTNTSGAPAATTGVDSGSQPSGGDQTNIDVQAPSMPAPGGNTESTTVNETNRVTEVADTDDNNWGIIVGAGLIGLTVLALLLNSRRTA